MHQRVERPHHRDGDRDVRGFIALTHEVQHGVAGLDREVLDVQRTRLPDPQSHHAEQPDDDLIAHGRVLGCLEELRELHRVEVSALLLGPVHSWPVDAEADVFREKVHDRGVLVEAADRADATADRGLAPLVLVLHPADVHVQVDALDLEGVKAEDVEPCEVVPQVFLVGAPGGRALAAGEEPEDDLLGDGELREGARGCSRRAGLACSWAMTSVHAVVVVKALAAVHSSCGGRPRCVWSSLSPTRTDLRRATSRAAPLHAQNAPSRACSGRAARPPSR